MLIIVCFLSAFISGLMPADPSGEILDTDKDKLPLTFNIVVAIAKFLSESMIVRNLTIYIPALLAIPIVYFSVGARKYNMAEYLTAMIYMTSSFLLFGIIISPLSLLSDDMYSALELVYSILICSMAMYKAFPVGSAKRRIAFFILYLFVCSTLYLLIMSGVALIIKYGIG